MKQLSLGSNIMNQKILEGISPKKMSTGNFNGYFSKSHYCD